MDVTFGTTSEGQAEKPTHGLSRLPTRTDTTAANLPESLAYRIKRHVLGPPLVTDNLEGQTLGKPTALAVLSSDVMSSSAYATEQMLRILVMIGGLAAFSIVTPMTAAILAVLAVVTICYRDVVRSYPKAGGSYVVSRDNFGPNVAQVAGAALLISYTITVAVSVAAGADAMISAFPALGSDAVPLSVAFVVILAYVNLRGIREAGQRLRRSDLFLYRQYGPADCGRTGQRDQSGIAACCGHRQLGETRARQWWIDSRYFGVLSLTGIRQWKFGHDRN